MLFLQPLLVKEIKLTKYIYYMQPTIQGCFLSNYIPQISDLKIIFFKIILPCFLLLFYSDGNIRIIKTSPCRCTTCNSINTYPIGFCVTRRCLKCKSLKVLIGFQIIKLQTLSWNVSKTFLKKITHGVALELTYCFVKYF